MSAYPGAMSSLRELTAHHEAGHAVASVMRGGSSFRSVEIGEGHGLTQFTAKRWDMPFISYAGPWGEARSQWPDGLPLDALDDEGCGFDDYVTGVFLHQPDDLAGLDAHHEFLATLPEPPPGEVEIDPYDTWNRELEAVWPAVLEVAARLLDGQVLTDSDVRAIVEGAIPD